MGRNALFSTGVGVVASLALGLAVSGCVPLVVGGAVASGASIADERRGFSGFVDDNGIRLAINDLWMRHSASMHGRLEITVDQGRVMLTGRAQNAQERLDAVRLAWEAKGVKEVINEIQIGPSPGLADSARDRWISTQFRTAITVDMDVGSHNYAFTTSERVIYLLGTAKNRAELDRVIDHARRMPEVERVVDHVIVSGG